MRIFYSSSHSPHARLSGVGSFLLAVSAVVLFLLGISFLYFILKHIFAISFALGLFFIFFVFPALARLLFMVYLWIMTALVTFFAFKGGDTENTQGDGVIDVKGKIIK